MDFELSPSSDGGSVGFEELVDSGYEICMVCEDFVFYGALGVLFICLASMCFRTHAQEEEEEPKYRSPGAE